MLPLKAYFVKPSIILTSSCSTSAYCSAGIMDSKMSNSSKSFSMRSPRYFPLSPPSLRRRNSSISARASAGAERYNASAVSKKFRSNSFVVSVLPCGLSSHPVGIFIRRSICLATAAPMFLRPHFRCDMYRSENSSFSAKSFSIPRFGRCEFASLKRRNSCMKFSCLILEVVSTFLSARVIAATNRIPFLSYNALPF